MSHTTAADRVADPTTDDLRDRNEVVVRGRVSGTPERRVLPSGDEVVTLRVVVRRRDTSGVDTLPVAVGPAPAPGRRPGAGQVGRRLLARAQRAPDGATVEVVGRLRRRWWAAGGARHSRVEIDASQVAVLGP